MTRSNKSRLENIIKEHEPSEHSVHHHPHEHIATHIALLIFISLFFLVSVFMFFTSSPAPTTAHAIVEFNEINLDFGIGEKISGFFETLMNPEHRTELLFILYVSWILIVGVMNLYFVERELKK